MNIIWMFSAHIRSVDINLLIKQSSIQITERYANYYPLNNKYSLSLVATTRRLYEFVAHTPVEKM